MGLFDFFQSKAFDELFDKALEDELSKTSNDDGIYEEIANQYSVLLRLLHITDFQSFRFPDYEDPRKVVVDGSEYDFDTTFSHDNPDATEALCAIDCLIADSEDQTESVLKKVENLITNKT